MRDETPPPAGRLSGLPDLRNLLDEGWRREAACRDEDPHVFDNDASIVQQLRCLASASVLLALLTCETCPVRRPCLSAALDPPHYNHAEDDQAQTIVRVYGIWGGTLEADRWSLRHLAAPEAIEELEETFETRVAARIEAWEGAYAAKGGQHIFDRDRGVLAMLAERAAEVGTIVPVTAPAPRRACPRCGTRLSWRQRSDALYCSGACRQASYRARAA